VIRRTAVRRLLAATVVVLVVFAFTASIAAAAAPGWKLLAVTGPTNLPPVTSEVQEVAVDAEGGTFTLSFENPSAQSATTGPIPYDTSAGSLEAALDSLASVAGVGGKVRVVGGPGNAGAELPYFVSFEGALAGKDVAQMNADGGGLQGAGHSVTVTTKEPGSQTGSGELAVFPTNVGGLATTGTVKVTVSLPGGVTTSGQGGGLIGKRWVCPAVAGLQTVECTYPVSVPSLTTGEGLVLPLAVDGSTALPVSKATVTVEGGLTATTPSAVYVAPVVVSATPAQPGMAGFWAGAFNVDGEPEVQAGGHPFSALTAFLRNTVRSPSGKTVPAGDMHDIAVDLPPGFVGNPLITERCPDSIPIPVIGQTLCLESQSRVGQLQSFEIIFGGSPTPSPVDNDVPPPGYAAQFSGNIIEGILQRVVASVRGDEDFGVSATAFNVPQARKLYGTLFALEGFPRGAAGRPFLTNPTDCALQANEHLSQAGPAATISIDTWQQQGVFSGASSLQPPVTGCRALTESWRGEGTEPKRPSFEFQPTVTQGSSGTGATARLHIDQEGLAEAGKLATADLKKTVVALPEGLNLNPSAADGLEACSEAQIGFKGAGFPMPTPIRFDEAAVGCPDGSKLGTIAASTPLLEGGLEGTIYLAAQEENPFHSLLALYLVIESPRYGIRVKLAGEVRPDPRTGQLTAIFDNNPQVPVEDLELTFRGGGPRSELATPEVCGSYRATGSLTPWSAETEAPGEAAAIEEPGFTVAEGCSPSAATRPFSPSFEAGTTSTQAGAYAPLVIKLARKDGEQEITSLDFTLPAGVTGRLAGIPYCPDAAIAAAQGRSGKQEQASPSCPAASELGTVDTAAGYGPEPIHVGGHLYLAGPYEGAPLSSVVITPAVAGPFDLGTVVVRAPLFVDPETAQITAKSDPLPTILRGIPLKLRSVVIDVNRQDFTLNPTSCEAKSITARVGSSNDASVTPSNRFQVGGCESLPFKPNLKIRLKGATKRVGHPALTAVLTAKPGEANIGRAQVNLPHGEFLDQGNLNKTCTKPVLLAGNCPASSVYGKAKAWTPLLEAPLEGPVYLVGGYGYKLPALVAELNGQIRVLLVGKVDSGKNKGIRNTFEVVPDAPVSRFVLEMKGGKKYGLLENSENLCKASKADRRAIVRFTGQNGKVDHYKPVVANQCGKKHKKSKKHKGHGAKGGASAKNAKKS
jgi:hypothetical protein